MSHFPPNLLPLSSCLRALGVASTDAADAEDQLYRAQLAHARHEGPAVAEVQLIAVQARRATVAALLRATISELDLALVLTAGRPKVVSLGQSRSQAGATDGRG